MNTVPSRLYYFSDAYGGHDEPDPLRNPDPDVLISTDFGSAIPRDREREFDTFGQEAVTDHLLRLIVQQHDEFAKRKDVSSKKRQEFLRAGTGVFINSAPRIDHSNAQPFYLATLRNGTIRVVTTPLEALSAVKNDVENLSYLPNPQNEQDQNGLYTNKEQFRSRLTPTLLHADTELPLQQANVSDIPDYKKGWHVAYVDRYGNMITWNPDVEGQWEEIRRVAENIDDTRQSVQIAIGQEEQRTQQKVLLGSSLGQADPGALSLYKNGNLDIVRKWHREDTAASKLRQSAYVLFGKPQIGDAVAVMENHFP